MRSRGLGGARVAILATDGFEESELLVPLETLRERGAKVDVVAPEPGRIRSWAKTGWGDGVSVDVKLADASADDYDALVLPGGVINPDQLRQSAEAVELVRAFAAADKPIAAICHGPWMLIEADLVRGQRVTSWPSLRTDLSNAGAHWEDRNVVKDGNLITSRKPDDLADFCESISVALQGIGART